MTIVDNPNIGYAFDVEQLSHRPVVVVLCEHASQRPPGLDALAGRVELRYADQEALADALTGASALFVWEFFSKALRDAWPSATELTWVHVAAAGVDTLLFDALVESDVVVTNAHGVFDRPIAEFVLASLLAHVKHLHASHDFQHDRVWRHRETGSLVGTEALVVGTGGIGREIARLLTALGVRVRGAGRTARSGDPDFGDIVASTELAQHVGSADHVVIAAPLTAQTRGLVGDEVLAALKPSAHLVNIGRGPIVDEQALIAALESGRLAAASLDVFETEPLPTESPLWSLPGVTISAHMSGDVVGWRDALTRQFIANVERWLAGEPLHGVVDKQLGFVSARPQEAP